MITQCEECGEYDTAPSLKMYVPHERKGSQRKSNAQWSVAVSFHEIDYVSPGEFENHYKLYLKLPLLISADHSHYEIWYNWFPEANAYAMGNKALPLRTRLLQRMAARKCWWGVKMYYLLVYKLVYGIVFR